MKINIPFLQSQNNRTYANTKDESIINAYIETGAANGQQIPMLVKRPGFFKRKAITTLVTNARAFAFYPPDDSYYALISDEVFLVSRDLTTVSYCSQVAISAISWAGGTVTVTGPGTASNPTFNIGNSVVIKDVTPTGYNGTYTITGAGVNTITYALASDPGASSSLSNARACVRIYTNNDRAYFQAGMANGLVLMNPDVPSGSATGQLFYISSNKLQRVTSANWPTDSIGQPVYLDGYLFTLSRNYLTAKFAQINNCALSDVTTWSALDYIAATKYSDSGVGLAKMHNYIVCFKERSIEMFYNADNAAGSPLSLVSNTTYRIGALCAESIVNINDEIFFASLDSEGGVGIHSLSGNGLQKISTNAIDRIISSAQTTLKKSISSTSGSSSDAYSLSWEGHRFYVLHIYGSINRTLVFDVSNRIWSEWTTNNGSDVQTVFFANFALSGDDNTLLLEKATGDIYEISPPPIGSANATTYKDGTKQIKVVITTNPLDGGTQDRKQMPSLRIVGDKATSSTNLSVSYSDDDYATWSTARTIDLSTLKPLFRFGQFRRRAFKFTHEDDYAMRLVGFEIDIERGK